MNVTTSFAICSVVDVLVQILWRGIIFTEGTCSTPIEWTVQKISNLIVPTILLQSSRHGVARPLMSGTVGT